MIIKGIPSIEGGVTTEIGAVQSLLAQAGPALAALQPPLLTIDAVVALFNLFGAIPDLIAGDVEGYLQAVEEAFEKVSKLTGLVPQVAVPRMVADTIAMLSAALDAMDTLVGDVVDMKAEAEAAVVQGQATSNAYLEAHGECIKVQADQMAKHIGASMGPINDIMGIASKLIQMVPGGSELPSIADASSVPLESLSATIQATKTVLDQLQIPGVP